MYLISSHYNSSLSTLFLPEYLYVTSASFFPLIFYENVQPTPCYEQNLFFFLSCFDFDFFWQWDNWFKVRTLITVITSCT